MYTPAASCPKAAYSGPLPMGARTLSSSLNGLLWDNISGWRDCRHRSIGAAILECSILDIQDAAAIRIDRWGDSGVSDGNDTLTRAELAARPKAKVPPTPPPLEHHDGLEA